MSLGAILRFPRRLVDEPVISRVIRELDVEVNILRARITPREDGVMYAVFIGTQETVDHALSRLRNDAVEVTPAASDLAWDEKVCVHCTACVGQCSTGALSVETTTSRVAFDPGRCIACELCVPACGYGAISVVTDDLTGWTGGRR